MIKVMSIFGTRPEAIKMAPLVKELEDDMLSEWLDNPVAYGAFDSNGKLIGFVEGFLEEKLAILGLNYREREEFITYWAKDLEKSNYVFVRFMPKYEIDEEMPLIVSPAPDTMIRVMMQFKNLDERIEIDEQELTPVERTGFTVVEWGGVDLGKWY